MPPTIQEKQILSVGDVARLLGVSAATVRRMAVEGRIPHRRIGEKILRFHAESIDAWLRDSDAPEAGAVVEIDAAPSPACACSHRPARPSLPRAGSVAEAAAMRLLRKDVTHADRG